jgi:hypothetical protein
MKSNLSEVLELKAHLRLSAMTLTALMLGCAHTAVLEFPRYADVREMKKGFELTSERARTIDSLRISVRFVPQDTLDAYFLGLNASSISGSEIGVTQGLPGSDGGESPLMANNRMKVAEIAAERARFPVGRIGDVAAGITDVWPALRRSGPYVKGVVASRKFPVPDESRCNPYTLYDISDVVRLEVFEVIVTNLAHSTRQLSTSEWYLTDDLGNQQKPIDIDFFENSYVKANQKPARYANVHRTLLQDSPVFPGQMRKVFMAFYAIPEDAREVVVRYVAGANGEAIETWDFKQVQNERTDRYVCIPVKVTGGIEDRGVSLPPKTRIAGAVVFSDPQESQLSRTGENGWTVIYVDEATVADSLRVFAVGADGLNKPGCKAWYGVVVVPFDRIRGESIGRQGELIRLVEAKGGK